MWDRIRENFPALKEIIYINTASIGLSPVQVTKTVEKWLEEKKYGNLYWRKWYSETREAARLAAKLINANERNIAIIENTSIGINLIANSINWKKGENIVTNNLEFPTNIFPWQVQAKRHGLELRVAQAKNGRIDIKEYEKLVDDKTKAIAISWVEFSNGFRHDLMALCELAEKHDAYLIVDGIQGIGALKLDVKKTPVDAVVTGAQKWLLGFPGAGFMYISDKLLDEMSISFGGWLADKDPFNFEFREFTPDNSARRFELGTPAFISCIVLKTTLEYILKIGIDKIQERDLELAQYLIEKACKITKILSPTDDGKPMSPIVSVKVKNPQEVYEKLKAEKIIVASRRGGLRISPHFYNNKEDIDLLLQKLREYIT